MGGRVVGRRPALNAMEIARQDLPRVLFLTPAAFNRITGGGITFGNLFRGWPKDRLATVHNDPVPTDDDVCDQYYPMSAAEIRRWGPLERIAPSVRPGSSVAVQQAQVREGAPKAALKFAKRLLFGDMLPDRGRLSPPLDSWVSSFRPELLYTILGSNAMMELALALHERFQVPMAIHIMDDWPATSYRGGLLGPVERARMERLFARIVEVATVRMGICDAMCDAYARRYGRSFLPFQNAVEVAQWARSAEIVPAPGRRKEILYIGSILPFAQLESLADCCRAVDHLARSGVDVRLSIHSPPHDLERHGASLPRSPHVHMGEAISDDAALIRRLHGADALLLPVSFDAYTERFIRYSMPTKVPAYLASGTPILAYGPESVAQIRYAADAGWAHVVTRREPAVLEAAVREVLFHDALRERIATRARACAVQHHDVAAVRPQFQRALAEAARGRAL